MRRYASKNALTCEAHGHSAGKKGVWCPGGLLTPPRLWALWEDALRALALSMADAIFNMGEPEQTQSLEASVMTQKLCLRAEFRVNNAGAGIFLLYF